MNCWRWLALVSIAVVACACSAFEGGNDVEKTTTTVARAETAAKVAWIPEAELIPWATGPTAEIGVPAVVLDGDRIAVGAPHEYNGWGLPRGVVYVFKNRDSVWHLEQRIGLKVPNSRQERLGHALALSGDLLLVNPVNDAPWVFHRNEDLGGWVERGQLTETCFNAALALSVDVAVIGCPGRVHVFRRSGAELIAGEVLSPADVADRHGFGGSLALDRNTLAVGSPALSGGSVSIYVKRQSRWVLQQRLSAPAEHGFSGGLSVSGDTLVSLGYSGKEQTAHVYERRGSLWTSQETLRRPFEADRWTGDVSVAGDTLLFGSARGVVDVLTRKDSKWTLRQQLRADKPANATLVASSARHALVSGAGLVTVFERHGSEWRPKQTLGIYNASSVTPSRDHVRLSGSRVAIATTEVRTDPSPEFFLATYVFAHDGSHWAAEERLAVGPTSFLSYYTPAVGLSAENLLTVANSDDTPYVAPLAFVRRGSTWERLPDLVADDGAELEGSVAVWDDTAIVGVKRSRAAYVFRRDERGWRQEKKIEAPADAAGLDFGSTVDLRGDVALIGAVNQPGSGVTPGAAYVFVRDGQNWAPQGRLVAAEGTGLSFGWALQLLDDGAVVAAPFDEPRGVHVFARSGASWSAAEPLRAPPVSTPDTAVLFGVALAAHDDALLVSGLAYPSQFSVAYIYGRDGQRWALEQELSDATQSGRLGGAAGAAADRLLSTGAESPVPTLLRRAGTTPLGGACSSGTECASTFCANGFCCKTACADSCDVCGQDGECGLLPEGTRCGPDPLRCASLTSYDVAPTCDALGKCKSTSVPCQGGFACVAGQCASDCVGVDGPDDALCADSHWCNGEIADPRKRCETDNPGGASCERPEQCASGACQTNQDGKTRCLGARGHPCSVDSECASSLNLLCRDGYCCNSACTGTCEACDLDGLEGQCLPVPNGRSPLPNREPCKGDATGVCRGYCNGSVRESCYYPGDVCQPARCDGNTLYKAGLCALGTCQPPSTQYCHEYVCDDTDPTNVSCKTECGSHNDCVSTTGHQCNFDIRRCVQSGNQCRGRTVVEPGGAEYPCLGRCVGGFCDNSCSRNEDCDPNLCVNGTCVKAAHGGSAGTSDDDSCACRTVGVSRSRFDAGIGYGAALLALVALRRRRRRSRRSAGATHRYLLTLTSAACLFGCQIIGDYQQFSGKRSDAGSPKHPSCSTGAPDAQLPNMRRVTSDSGCFWTDETEVTNAEYARFLADQRAHPAEPPCAGNVYEPARPEADAGDLCERRVHVSVTSLPSHPVVCVDWCDALGYCQWANKTLCKDDFGRPDQAAHSDWYAACSNEGTTLYPFGDFHQAETCNDGEWPDAGCAVGNCTTTAAGTLRECVTQTGIFDLSGNVAEWTQACADTDGAHDACLIRGGSMQSSGNDVRCDVTRSAPRSSRDPTRGFRCCAYPGQ